MGGPPPIPAGVEASQTYCLRWNNHKSNLIEILDALIKVESYVDCTIVVDDRITFKAHRVVLAANSPYFQAILQDVPMDHCSIIFPGVKAFEMRALLEYMYTGEVNVTQSQIPRIMRIAEELEVKGLFDMADLKEKFNKLADDTQVSNSYTQSSNQTSYTIAASSSTVSANSQEEGHLNGAKELQDTPPQSQNSSTVISSTHISPIVAPVNDKSSPNYNDYKSQVFSHMNLPENQMSTTQISTLSTNSVNPERTTTGQWPLSPNSAAAAAAMLSSVYESAPDMNPLKRKKLSSISSMLMNRDTPILRNVLAQSNQTESTQVMPLIMSGAQTSTPDNGQATASGSQGQRNERSSSEKAASSGFNGTDFSADKKYSDEQHSPYTDRSFDEDNYDHKGFIANYGSNNANQKPEWKRYKQYTRNDIMSAIQCVRDGMSALQASRKFGVPSRTLYDKVKKLGITTGRPMNRSLKRSTSSMEGSAAFPYVHGYGQPEVLLSTMHEGRNGGEESHETHKEHRSVEHAHLAANIPHPAAALLDHAFLQQALESRGGDIAGRDALHAMALAAAAHAAVNRISNSPGQHSNASGRRSPSPGTYSTCLKYSGLQRSCEQTPMNSISSDKEQYLMDKDSDRDCELNYEERERDADDEDDQVEDLSVQRHKDTKSPENILKTNYSASPSPSYPLKSGVIMNTSKIPTTELNSTMEDEMSPEKDMKRELVIDEEHVV